MPYYDPRFHSQRSTTPSSKDTSCDRYGLVYTDRSDDEVSSLVVDIRKAPLVASSIDNSQGRSIS